MAKVGNWRSLGRCSVCQQQIHETDTGSIVGHATGCPNAGQAP